MHYEGNQLLFSYDRQLWRVGDSVDCSAGIKYDEREKSIFRWEEKVMKRKKNWICLLMTMLLLFLVPFAVQAKDTDVTKKLSSDARVKKLTRLVAYYTDAEVLGRKKGKVIKEKMDDANLLSMSAYMGYSDRKGYQWTKKEIQKIAYNLFGKKPNVSKIPSFKSPKRKWISKRHSSWQKKPYIYAGGDWGTYKPGYKNLKIIKKSSSVYEIRFTNVMGSYENSRASKNIGETTFRLKKTSKSSYGYIITKIQYKGYGLTLSDIR